MTPKEEAPTTYLTDLFERARRALAEHHMGADTEVLDPQSLDHAANGSSGSVVAQLRIDDRTREVIIRFYDVHTGATIRDVAPQQVVAAAARLRIPVV